MLIKIAIKTYNKKQFIYSFILNNKKFIVIYNKTFDKKHIILLPNDIYFLNFTNNNIIFIIMDFIKKKEIKNFYKFFYKNIVYNEIIFSRKVILKGLGYKIEKISSNFMKLSINLSHPFFIYIPTIINILKIQNQSLFFSSNNKEIIDLFSNIFYKIKKPNLYKNKGIFFFNILKVKL